MPHYWIERAQSFGARRLGIRRLFLRIPVILTRLLSSMTLKCLERHIVCPVRVLMNCWIQCGTSVPRANDTLPNDIADADQDNFNFFFSSLCIHIEQAFGILVARWRILQSALQFSVRRCTDVICLLMKLHNFCIEHDGDGSSYVDDLTDEEKQQLEQDVNQGLDLSHQVAEEFRDRSQTRVTTRSRTRQANFGRTKRDKLVAIVKEKNRRRPAPAPLTAHYQVTIDRL